MEACFKSANESHGEALVEKSWLAFDLGPGIVDSIWRLQKGIAKWKLQVPLQPQTGAGSSARCRLVMFELGCEFDQMVVRCSPRPPSGSDRRAATRSMFREWLGLLRADKINQLEALKAGTLTLPQLPLEWGPAPDTLSRMPCAAWLHVPQRVEG